MATRNAQFPPILGQRISRSVICGALFFGVSLFLCIYEKDLRFSAGFAVAIFMFWSAFSCVHDFWIGKIKSFNAELVVSKASFKSINLVFKETLEDGEEVFREYYYAKQKELPSTDVKYTCYFHEKNPSVLLGFEPYNPDTLQNSNSAALEDTVDTVDPKDIVDPDDTDDLFDDNEN